MNKVRGTFISILRKYQLNVYLTTAALGRNLSYKSDVSLHKIYPTNNLTIFTPTAPQAHKDEKFSGFIPINQIEVTYSRSSGPGGQHVNRVNTKVELRFKVETAEWISEKIRNKISKEFSNRITKEGYFIIKSDVTRSQQMNLADGLEKLRCFVRELEVETAQPTEETIEKLRKRHEKASRERLQQKRQRSQIKADRQGTSLNF